MTARRLIDLLECLPDHMLDLPVYFEHAGEGLAVRVVMYEPPRPQDTMQPHVMLRHDLVGVTPEADEVIILSDGRVVGREAPELRDLR